jgi:hypothetical protein
MFKNFVHVKWVHCHHRMARPRVADRGHGLQIWRVAANILNKQSRTADSELSSSLEVGRGANNNLYLSYACTSLMHSNSLKPLICVTINLSMTLFLSNFSNFSNIITLILLISNVLFLMFVSLIVLCRNISLLCNLFCCEMISKRVLKT